MPDDICAPDNPSFIEVEIAALERYFFSCPTTRKRHVCMVEMSREQLDTLLEYDRRLAALPTCDVIELIESHVASRRHSTETPLLASTDGASSSHLHLLHTDKPKQQDVREQMYTSRLEEEDVDLLALPTIFVAQHTVRNALASLQVTALRERRVQSALLHAARETLQDVLARPLDIRHYRQVVALSEQVQAIQRWRRQRRNAGYIWQRVVTLTPAQHQGQIGWNLVIGVPIDIAA